VSTAIAELGAAEDLRLSLKPLSKENLVRSKLKHLEVHGLILPI
jgi:hypothetical protein